MTEKAAVGRLPGAMFEIEHRPHAADGPIRFSVGVTVDAARRDFA